jgi:pimeloyl-ACP methyl ester carboxylesterase
LETDAAKEGFKLWRNTQGEGIGWHRASAQGAARRCVLVIHGNAGCAGDRFHYADALQAIEPMDFYILEYPGYGGRAGEPSQKTILQAAEDALKCIPGECPVFLVAESLGTGVASFLAGAHPDRVRGVLLIAPYNNMTAVAQKHMPLFPVGAILLDRYPSGAWLSKYRGPVAVLLAGRDTIIPTELGRDLNDRYAGPKKLWIEPDLGHNDLHMPRPGTWQEVVEFWNSTAPEPR